MRTLLSIDYSTTCTGWSIFKGKKLIDYGFIKNKAKKNGGKLNSLLTKLEYMATEIHTLVYSINPDMIVIEEITGSKQRLGQKTLDMGHAVMLLSIRHFIEKVAYYDVSGSSGWRFHLGLRYSLEDKAYNKKIKALNKKMAKNHEKYKKVTHKHLAQRFANRKYEMMLDVDKRTTDGDIADSICMGSAFLDYRIKDLK